MMHSKPPAYIFYIIIVSQFCCTSLWFAVNAILPQLQAAYHWPAEAVGYITMAVQSGFIVGTFVYAVLGMADRFSPAWVFFISSMLAATGNAVALLDPSSIGLTLISRLITGFFLAGVYPVGMKIASDWNKEGLGHWLGALVGALVLGTSFPHALKLLPSFIAIQPFMLAITSLAVSGGLLMWLVVKEGPYHHRASRFSFRAVRQAFRIDSFRSAAFGYFGHMWELYTFWAFTPVMLVFYRTYAGVEFSVSMWSFIIIASGFLGCLAGGKISLRSGSKAVAMVALIISGICCLLSPWFYLFTFPVFIGCMVVWGISVVADSPQFSTLVAAHAPPQIRGSALTIVTCIGFAITIVSIQLINAMQSLISERYLLLLLAPGPVLGVIGLYYQNGLSWKK
jgi:MFS family permease